MEALQRLHNRGSISTGYDIDNSLKFEDDNNERMQRSVSSGGSSPNAQTHTFSLWLKRTELGYRRTWGTGVSGLNEYFFYFDANDYFNIYSYSSGYQLRFISNGRFRDTSAWYHLVFAIDTTQSTEADRVKIYLNGVRITDWSTSTYPSQNANLQIADKIYIGTQRNENPDFSGYISEFVYLDGTQAAVTDLGEFDADTGIWKPIDVSSLSFGTNGCYLKFDNASDLGEDANGGTSFTLTNITSADQATDTPTNNFATLNPLIRFDESEMFAGATRVKKTSGINRWRTFVSTQAVSNGKWYAEFRNPLSSTTGSNRFVGFVPAGNITQSINASGDFLGGSGYTDSIGFYYEGSYYKNDSGTSTENTGYGSSWTNETIGIALDMDNNKVYWSINGTWQNSGDPTSGATGTGALDILDTSQPHYIGISIYNTNADFQGNFGGYTDFTISSAASDANGYGTFEYAPPSGYYALCTKNLAEFGG